MSSFRALYLEAGPPAGAAIRDLADADLPPLDDGVTVNVAYSTLNYKDALAITGSAPVVRRFPMVPGIDFAGTVFDSPVPQWRAGDEVLVTGWEVGEVFWGGLAQRTRAQPGWLVRRPDSMSLFDTMAVGTAGFTAALAVTALERHGLSPDAGPVLVTGATGGVGSLAIVLLTASGYTVTASTGKPQDAEYLRALGAAAIVERSTLSAPGKPLQQERWAGAVDTVGSHTLANVCASTMYGGVVAACGLAQGMDLPATVAPFILRGVSLVGINSVLTPMPERQAAWDRIERSIDRDQLRGLAQEVGLADAITLSPRLLAGELRGRVVVDVNR